MSWCGTTYSGYSFLTYEPPEVVWATFYFVEELSLALAHFNVDVHPVGWNECIAVGLCELIQIARYSNPIEVRSALYRSMTCPIPYDGKVTDMAWLHSGAESFEGFYGLTSTIHSYSSVQMGVASLIVAL
jgi:hypothetical protein